MTEIALKNQSTENIYRCKEQLDQIYTDLGLSGKQQSLSVQSGKRADDRR